MVCKEEPIDDYEPQDYSVTDDLEPEEYSPATDDLEPQECTLVTDTWCPETETEDDNLRGGDDPDEVGLLLS